MQQVQCTLHIQIKIKKTTLSTLVIDYTPLCKSGNLGWIDFSLLTSWLTWHEQTNAMNHCIYNCRLDKPADQLRITLTVLLFPKCNKETMWKNTCTVSLPPASKGTCDGNNNITFFHKNQYFFQGSKFVLKFEYTP